MSTVGVIFPPDQPPTALRDVALAAESAGLDELWLWEDCFAESGIAPASAALAWTERISVGIGLMPVPLRNVALTAMEIATVAELFPGRFMPGIGHGVLDWMSQAGVRAASPMTLLREYTLALRRLLDGELVSMNDDYVKLDKVQLRWPPTRPVPLFIGGMGDKTLSLAADMGNGVILTVGSDQVTLEHSIATIDKTPAGRSERIINFLSAPVTTSVDDLEVLVRKQIDAGVTNVAVCGLSAEGPPDGSSALLDFIPLIAQVRERVLG